MGSVCATWINVTASSRQFSRSVRRCSGRRRAAALLYPRGTTASLLTALLLFRSLGRKLPGTDTCGQLPIQQERGDLSRSALTQPALAVNPLSEQIRAPRVRLVRRENRSARPASDGSVVRIYPRAPRPIGPLEQVYTWGQAVEMVKEGYVKFSPTMASMFEDMVNEQRIDVPAINGKRGGAYCSAAVPGIGPFQVRKLE
eukprot:1177678-Prorocentrum_minimum.AAC.3